MKTMAAAVIAAALILVPLSAQGQSTAPSSGLSAEMRGVSARSGRYLVKVFVTKNADTPTEGHGTGSGELIRGTDGVVRILTNQHVVGDADHVWVQFDGEQHAQKVAVLGRDEHVDMALLEAPKPLPAHTQPIAIAETDVAVGDLVYALGFPSGSRSVSFGVVVDRSSPHGTANRDFHFSHQAPIAPGSSGGALIRLNAQGEEELVGINTAVGVQGGRLISNYGYSIRPSVIARMIPKLESERVVSHALMGMSISDTNRMSPAVYEKLSKSAYPPARPGIMVLQIGGPAAGAGIQPGDMIRECELFLEGQWVNFPLNSAGQFAEEVFFSMPVGTKMRLKTERGSQKFGRDLVLVEFPVKPKESQGPEGH